MPKLVDHLRDTLHDPRIGRGAPPVDEIVREVVERSRAGSTSSPASRWKARRAQAAIPAAAAAAVIIGVVGILTVLGAEGDRTARDSALSIPDSQRLVAMNGIAVAIPDTWSTNDVMCGTPMSDTVYFKSEGMRACLIKDPPRVSALAFIGSDSQHAIYWIEQAIPAGSIGGMEYSRVPTQPARDSQFGYAGAIVVPEAGVVLVMSAAQVESVDEVLDSATTVPGGMAAVPFDPNVPPAENAELIRAAGFDVQLSEQSPPPGNSGGLLADPTFGSVVPEGATVVLTVTD